MKPTLMPFRLRPVLFAAAGFVAGLGLFCASSRCQAGTVVRFSTNRGEINIELLDGPAPITVQNFLAYVNAGDYNSTFIHRSAVDGSNNPFVIQGGGYKTSQFATLPTATHITERPPIQNEFRDLNTRGSIAMAKKAGDLNSATSEWFINLKNNPFLDQADQKFTVFGYVLGNNMNIVDGIAALPKYNFGSQSAFKEVPVQNYSSGTPNASNMVVVNSVFIVPPFQNPLNRLDVNNNGIVAPLDVLVVINDVTANGFHQLAGSFSGGLYFDVDGNKSVNESDISTLVGFLNAGSTALAGPVAFSAVPEPSGIALAIALAAGAALFVRSRVVGRRAA